jgi:hypothetical protein
MRCKVLGRDQMYLPHPLRSWLLHAGRCKYNENGTGSTVWGNELQTILTPRPSICLSFLYLPLLWLNQNKLSGVYPLKNIICRAGVHAKFSFQKSFDNTYIITVIFVTLALKHVTGTGLRRAWGGGMQLGLLVAKILKQNQRNCA